MTTSFDTWPRRAALAALVSAFVAQTASGDGDSERHPILEPADQFGVRARSELKDLLRPGLGDTLREAAVESPVPAQTLLP